MKLNNVGVRLFPKLSQLVDSTSAFVSDEERNDESYTYGDRGVGDVNPEPQVIVPAPAPESASAKDIYALGRVLCDMLSIFRRMLIIIMSTRRLRLRWPRRPRAGPPPTGRNDHTSPKWSTIWNIVSNP